MAARRVPRNVPSQGKHLRRAFHRGPRRHRRVSRPGTNLMTMKQTTQASMPVLQKVTIIGGGGVRTPLLVHGLAQAGGTLPIRELSLFDLDADRTETVARLGREIVRQ